MGALTSAAEPVAVWDGHPFEAALEMRRRMIVDGVVDEICPDLLDLAGSIAWIGKAVARCSIAARLRLLGVEPAAWTFIPQAVAADHVLRTGLSAADNSVPSSGMECELAFIRSSSAFRNARAAVGAALDDRDGGRLVRFREIVASWGADGSIVPILGRIYAEPDPRPVDG